MLAALLTWSYLQLTAKKLQIETISCGLCGYLMVAQRLLSVARTSVRLRSSGAHLGEACEMRFSSAQLSLLLDHLKMPEKGFEAWVGAVTQI